MPLAQKLVRRRSCLHATACHAGQPETFLAVSIDSSRPFASLSFLPFLLDSDLRNAQSSVPPSILQFLISRFFFTFFIIIIIILFLLYLEIEGAHR